MKEIKEVIAEKEEQLKGVQREIKVLEEDLKCECEALKIEWAMRVLAELPYGQYITISVNDRSAKICKTRVTEEYISDLLEALHMDVFGEY